MRKKSQLLGIHASPSTGLRWFYYLLPFVFVLVAYHVASTIYLESNPGGKIIPSFSMMGKRMWDLGFSLDSRTHTYLLWADTAASLARFMAGLLLAAAVGLLFGINIAIFPALEFLLLPEIITLSFVPMLAVLPVLLMVVGIGEEAKIVLIFLGLVFFITRDIYGATKEIPQELLVKARTLGASELALVYRVVLPMIMPRLFETVRQSLGPAWLYLIAGEGIAASEGLGYRIYLVRRTSDFTAAIPYVLWITLLAFAIYYLVMGAERHLYPWKQ
jgi:NitT/TauT family transport system permease protein